MHPQDIVQILYEAILKIQNPNKRDDMTIMIIKRKLNIKFLDYINLTMGILTKVYILLVTKD